MIRVRILGKGLIPRGGGLAPKKEPIYVDFNYLTTLVYSRNLKIQFLNPENDKFEDITVFNFKKIYDKISPVIDMQLSKADIQKKKEQEEAKKRAEEEARQRAMKEEQEKVQHQFSKKDKYFNKKKFEQRKVQQEQPEVVISEEKTEI